MIVLLFIIIALIGIIFWAYRKDSREIKKRLDSLETIQQSINAIGVHLTYEKTQTQKPEYKKDGTDNKVPVFHRVLPITIMTEKPVTPNIEKQ